MPHPSQVSFHSQGWAFLLNHPKGSLLLDHSPGRQTDLSLQAGLLGEIARHRMWKTKEKVFSAPPPNTTISNPSSRGSCSVAQHVPHYILLWGSHTSNGQHSRAGSGGVDVSELALKS